MRTHPRPERLTEHECRERLAAAHAGHLAVTVEGRPLVAPVRYLYDAGSGCLAVPLGPGELLDAVLGAPVATLEADGTDDTGSAWTVLAVGRAEQVVDTEIWRCAVRHAAVHPDVPTESHWVEITSAEVTGHVQRR